MTPVGKNSCRYTHAKKIILIRIMVGVLCVTAVNICYAEIENRAIELECTEYNDDVDGPYQLIDAGQKGKTLTIITKDIKIKKEKKLGYFSGASMLIARCMVDHSMRKGIDPSKYDPNPTFTCPEDSGMEVQFSFIKLPKGCQCNDLTYYADLVIKSNDGIEAQEVVNSQQQIKPAIQDSVQHSLISNSLVSDKQESVKQSSEYSEILASIEKSNADFINKMSEQVKINRDNEAKRYADEKIKLENALKKLDEVVHGKETQDIIRISDNIKKLQEQENKLKDERAKLQAEYALAAKRK